MITKEQAYNIAMSKVAPGSRYVHCVPYENFYILQINGPDPAEGHLDPFFSVDRTTGEFRDFDISSGGPALIRQFL